MPIKIIEDEGKFHLVLEAKVQGRSMMFGVAEAPVFDTHKDAVVGKRNVTIMRSGGVTAALYIKP